MKQNPVIAYGGMQYELTKPKFRVYRHGRFIEVTASEAANDQLAIVQLIELNSKILKPISNDNRRIN